MFILPLQNDLILIIANILRLCTSHDYTKAYHFMVSHRDSAFVIWNVLIYLEEQDLNDLKRENDEDDSD